MEKSEHINELATALCKAQGVLQSATKDSDNPFFKSKYADLATVIGVCRKPLADNGLSFTQLANSDGNIVTVETVLMHTSGQYISTKLSMTAKDPTPQAIGSCITYARRYSLSSVLGIASEEDDDGNHAQGLQKIQQKPKVEIENKPALTISLKDRVIGTGITKFGDADKFKSWRIDNNLVENIDKATDNELNFCLAVMREYKK